MKHNQDHQKREAKRSLWDMDGIRVKKRSRNKGKGRAKDKALIQAATAPQQEWEDEAEYWEDEILKALYAPCERED